MDTEKTEAAVARGALLVRMVTLALAKAGYEFAEPLSNDEIHGVVLLANKNGIDSVVESL